MDDGWEALPVPPPWLVEQWAFEDAALDERWPRVSSPTAGPCPPRGAEAPPVVPLESLLAVDPRSLSDAEQIEQLVALEAVKSRVDAAQARLLAAMQCADESEEHFVVEDVRLALRLSRGVATVRLANARMLSGFLPQTLAALEAGVITSRHADAVCEAAERVDGALRQQLEAMVLPRRDPNSRGTGSIEQRALLRIDPDGGERRHVQARADRAVYRYGEYDGMANLVFRATATDVATALARVDAAAHLVAPGDVRTVDQRRADVFFDALMAGIPPDGLPLRQGRAPSAEVVISLSTLLGFDDQPADLAGYGAIPASLARELATDADATWRRLVTDPTTGDLLDHGRATYRPPAGLRDFVVARDGVCAAPGCSMPARLCDLDHQQPWESGGPTDAANLSPLCGRDHDAKTKRHLRYRRDPDGGYTWTTRTGHQYRTHAPLRWNHPEPDG